jgi:hypothetical protein
LRAALNDPTDAATDLITALDDAGRAATGADAAACAADAAEPYTEAAVTGWQAVTVALSDYATMARKIGGDRGQSIVGAFQSSENAVGEFVKTGKLIFRDLVTSLLADPTMPPGASSSVASRTPCLARSGAREVCSQTSCTRAARSDRPDARGWSRRWPSPEHLGCIRVAGLA